jgi:hypothetical protein
MAMLFTSHPTPTHTLTHTLLFSMNPFSEKRENAACFDGQYRQTSKKGFILSKRLQTRTYVTLVSMFWSPLRSSSFDIKISINKKQAGLACVAKKKNQSIYHMRLIRTTVMSREIANEIQVVKNVMNFTL